MLLKIGFIGAGKVGFSLGKHFTDHDICVTGYYSRSINSSKEAAAFTKTKYYKDLNELIKESDTLLLTIPDGSIPAVYSEIIQSDIDGKSIAHLSGALSSKVFFGIDSKGANGCSIHPICAVNDKFTGYLNLSKAYFTIEGTNTEALADVLRSCGNQVEQISPENKVRYHAAAVFASNLAVGLYDAAVELLQSCGLSKGFSDNALKSLFLGNAENVASDGVINSLTGPVERADTDTVKKHLDSLQGDMKQAYCLLSRRLIEIARQKNPDKDYSDLCMLLDKKD